MALPDWLQFNVNGEAAVAAIQKLNTDPTNPHQPSTDELLGRMRKDSSAGGGTADA